MLTRRVAFADSHLFNLNSTVPSELFTFFSWLFYSTDFNRKLSLYPSLTYWFSSALLQYLKYTQEPHTVYADMWSVFSNDVLRPECQMKWWKRYIPVFLTRFANCIHTCCCTALRFCHVNPSAWGHLNPSSYCDVGRLFYGVFKLWSKLQRKKWRNNF